MKAARQQLRNHCHGQRGSMVRAILFALKDFEVAAVTNVIADLERFHSIGMRLGGVDLPEGNVSFGGNGGLVEGQA